MSKGWFPVLFRYNSFPLHLRGYMCFSPYCLEVKLSGDHYNLPVSLWALPPSVYQAPWCSFSPSLPVLLPFLSSVRCGFRSGPFHSTILTLNLALPLNLFFFLHPVWWPYHPRNLGVLLWPQPHILSLRDHWLYLVCIMGSFKKHYFCCPDSNLFIFCLQQCHFLYLPKFCCHIVNKNVFNISTVQLFYLFVCFLFLISVPYTITLNSITIPRTAGENQFDVERCLRLCSCNI